MLIAAPSNRGSYGSVSNSIVQSGPLNSASKQDFSPALLVIMRRQAEDLLLSDSNSQKGKEALQFILNVAKEISGDDTVDRIKKCKLLIRLTFNHLLMFNSPV